MGDLTGFTMFYRSNTVILKDWNREAMFFLFKYIGFNQETGVFLEFNQTCW